MPADFKVLINPTYAPGVAAAVGRTALYGNLLFVKAGTSNTAWILIRTLTDRELGIDHASTLLGNSNLSEGWTDFYNIGGSTAPDVNPFTTSAGGGASGAINTSLPGGVWRIQTGGTAGDQGWIGFNAGMLGSSTGNVWYMRSRFALNSAPNSNAVVSMLVLDVGTLTRSVGIGFVGATHAGGSNTYFTLFQGGTLNATGPAAGTQSAIAVDTHMHVFEMWLPIAGTTAYGSVDSETPISIATIGASTNANLSLRAEDVGGNNNNILDGDYLQVLTTRYAP